MEIKNKCFLNDIDNIFFTMTTIIKFNKLNGSVQLYSTVQCVLDGLLERWS